MAEHTLVMPKLGLTMTEGTLVEWKVAPGQSFRAGETLFVVETEKIANDVEAPSTGVMSEHLVEAGATVPAGSPVARWRSEVAEAASETQGTPNDPLALTSSATVPPPIQSPPPLSEAAPQVERYRERLIATPLARRLARERGIDLGRTRGSGPSGRITSADLSAKDVMISAAASCLDSVSASFFVAAEIDAHALVELRKKLSQVEKLKSLELVHLAGLAIARLLQANPSFNRIWTTDRGVVQLPGAAVVLVFPEREIIVQDAGQKRLSEFVGNPGQPDSGAAVSVVASISEHVTSMSGPLMQGQALLVTLGSTRRVFRPDAQGRPILADVITVIANFDLRVFNHTTAAAFIEGLKTYLESPLLILAA